MKKPNLSFPIDRKLLLAIDRDKQRLKLSRADVVRQILYKHYGWVDEAVSVLTTKGAA
jgi:hypothetical protein